MMDQAGVDTDFEADDQYADIDFSEDNTPTLTQIYGQSSQPDTSSTPQKQTTKHEVHLSCSQSSLLQDPLIPSQDITTPPVNKKAPPIPQTCKEISNQICLSEEENFGGNVILLLEWLRKRFLQQEGQGDMFDQFEGVFIGRKGKKNGLQFNGIPKTKSRLIFEVTPSKQVDNELVALSECIQGRGRVQQGAKTKQQRTNKHSKKEVHKILKSQVQFGYMLFHIVKATLKGPSKDTKIDEGECLHFLKKLVSLCPGENEIYEFAVKLAYVGGSLHLYTVEELDTFKDIWESRSSSHEKYYSQIQVLCSSQSLLVAPYREIFGPLLIRAWQFLWRKADVDSLVCACPNLVRKLKDRGYVRLDLNHKEVFIRMTTAALVYTCLQKESIKPRLESSVHYWNLHVDKFYNDRKESSKKESGERDTCAAYHQQMDKLQLQATLPSDTIIINSDSESEEEELEMWEDDASNQIVLHQDLEQWYLLERLKLSEQELIKEVLANTNSEAYPRSTNIRVAGVKRLVTGDWLNSDPINFFAEQMNKREKELLEVHGNRRPSLFFNTFFFTKLRNLVRDLPDSRQPGGTRPNPNFGTFQYDNVKGYRKRVPGKSKNVFGLSKLYIAVHHAGCHWIVAVVDFCSKPKKRIYMLDPLSMISKRARQQYQADIMNYLRHEYEKVYLFPMPLHESNQWDFQNTNDTRPPQQRNTDDCGIFSIMFQDLLARGMSLECLRTEIQDYRKYKEISRRCRERVAILCMNGSDLPGNQ